MTTAPPALPGRTWNKRLKESRELACLLLGMADMRVFRWRRLMSEGGREAVRADDEVVPAAELRRLEERVRDLERLLGRKTMENEILKEALELARAKKPILLSSSVPSDGSR